jgi:hypothetical protein
MTKVKVVNALGERYSLNPNFEIRFVLHSTVCEGGNKNQSTKDKGSKPMGQSHTWGPGDPFKFGFNGHRRGWLFMPASIGSD